MGIVKRSIFMEAKREREDKESKEFERGEGHVEKDMRKQGFNSEGEEDKNYLIGGKADKCKKRFSPKQLRKGRRIEREHTKNKDIAEEIAKDHLEEIPDYYTRLEQMEREAKMAKRKHRESGIFECLGPRMRKAVLREALSWEPFKKLGSAVFKRMRARRAARTARIDDLKSKFSSHLMRRLKDAGWGR